MVPVSWQEMECPKTKTIEFRKVAKRTPPEETGEAAASGPDAEQKA